MIKKQFLFFLLRWGISSLAMWVCISLFAVSDSPHNTWFFVIAGLVFSLVNSFIKPLATMMALPLIIFTMGIFSLIVNIGMVALTFWLLPGVHVDFWGVVLSSIAISLINSLVNLLIPSYNKK